MIPRTVQMAKAVAATFTTSDLDNYGNIILNGYLSVVPNTINKKAWKYKETAGAPVNLPALTQVQPALKGWTTNYMEYYTQLPVNAYNVNPGDPTMFEYDVHSYSIATGTITSIGGLQSGQGYLPGVYNNLPAIGGNGTGATLDVTVDVNGHVSAVTLNAVGSNYAVGDGLTVAGIGSGSGFSVAVATITIVNPAGESQWAQPPHRYYQNLISAVTPPQYVNNPQVIGYSFMYPVVDNPTPPPIDIL